MKAITIIVILICVFLIIILPLIVIFGIGPLLFSHYIDGISILVYIHYKDAVVSMSLEDYVKGVVAAEMLPRFHFEALKSQAVAARTYAARRMYAYGGAGCPIYPEVEVCTDFRYGQAWTCRETLMNKWGLVDYLKNMFKISRAVNATKGQILTYNGAIIDAVYHSSSIGQTESAREVWGNNYPYLKSVPSEYEYDSPHFKNIKEFSIEEIEQLLDIELEMYEYVTVREINGITGGEGSQKQEEERANVVRIIAKERDDAISIIERSEGDRVGKIQIGNKIFSGTYLRDALNLNSTNFSTVINGNTIKFITSGFGHGVGMSQYGADGMGRNGYNYIDILTHYYTGIELEILPR